MIFTTTLFYHDFISQLFLFLIKFGTTTWIKLRANDNFMKPFITIISFFITTLCFSQVTTTVQTVIVDSGKYEFKLQVKKDTSDYSKAYRILTNQVKLNPNNAELRYFLGYTIDKLNSDDGK